MNNDKLITTIKINDYIKNIIGVYKIYNHISYLQQLTYICTFNSKNKDANINVIINDVSRYGYKIDNCNEYKDLIISLEKIKTSINIQKRGYIKSKIENEFIEQIIRNNK